MHKINGNFTAKIIYTVFLLMHVTAIIVAITEVLPSFLLPCHNVLQKAYNSLSLLQGSTLLNIFASLVSVMRKDVIEC